MPTWILAFALAQASSSTWQEHNRRGEEEFKKGNMDASIREFDRAIHLEPRLAPHHWQRGISLYYAGRWEDCRKQFESHRTVNPEDVENAVWHFLCAAKTQGVSAAREKLIPIQADDRIPMKQVHDLFAGKAKVDDVIAAAGGGGLSGLFYGHLYVGLYLEADGKRKESLEHIRKAAEDYPASHYMWDVAQVHWKRRGK